MNLDSKHRIFGSNRGVSPVIGVILMVAITVILAAVIATFVMNMGPDQNSPANANWDWDADDAAGGSSNGEIYLSHDGGSSATVNEYTLSVTDDGDITDSLDLDHANDELTAGDEVVIGFEGSDDVNLNDHSDLDSSASDDLSSVAEVQLIWEDPEGDQTQIIDTYEP